MNYRTYPKGRNENTWNENLKNRRKSPKTRPKRRSRLRQFQKSRHSRLGIRFPYRGKLASPTTYRSSSGFSHHGFQHRAHMRFIALRVKPNLKRNILASGNFNIYASGFSICSACYASAHALFAHKGHNLYPRYGSNFLNIGKSARVSYSLCFYGRYQGGPRRPAYA